jgi:hypothetical protein
LRDSRNRDAERRDELQQVNSQLDAENKRLQALLNEGQRPAGVERFVVDDQVREDVGDAEVNLVEGLANNIDKRFDAINEREQRREQVEQDRVRRDEDRFYAELGTIIPNWDTLNHESDFAQWLDLHDQDARQSRRELLLDAVADRHPETAAAIFRAYSQSRGNGTDPHPVGQGVVTDPVSHRASSVTPNEGYDVVYSPAEVSGFFTRKSALYRSGKLVGKVLSDIVAEEAEISKAIEEGRVF